MALALRSLAHCCALLVLLAAPLLAQADATPGPQEQAMRAASEAARKALVRGPSDIKLREQAVLSLPEGYGFIPQREAAALMRAMGNQTNADFLGLVVPLGEGSGRWLVTVDYNPAGYVKDDEAQHWDAQKLLESLKEGTEAANGEREKLGIPPIVVTRWIEPPSYQADSHRLVWSAEARNKSGRDDDPTINYNTYLLGREGYLSLDLITSASAVDEDKARAHELLSAVKFNSGKAYTDFNSSTDKVAAYGLAALVAGIAVKKLGLLALIVATVVKFAKVIAVAAAGLVAGVARWRKARANRTV